MPIINPILGLISGDVKRSFFGNNIPLFNELVPHFGGLRSHLVLSMTEKGPGENGIGSYRIYLKFNDQKNPPLIPPPERSIPLHICMRCGTPLPPPRPPPPDHPLSAPEFPFLLVLPEEPMQPAARQTMMTVIVTSTREQNPGGIRHVPEFLTIDYSCCPDSYCSTMRNEEYLISGTHGGMNREP